MSAIRKLNDDFRTTFIGGRVMMTQGVAGFPLPVQMVIQSHVKSFAHFDRDNDPHDEHDFGSFNIGGEKFFWQISYYDKSMEYGSSDPGDPSKTTRVLTIMLAGEY
jgi:hypothetical protein